MLGNNEMFELEQEQTSTAAQVTYLALAAAAGAGLGFGVQALWKRYHTPSAKEIEAMKAGLEMAISKAKEAVKTEAAAKTSAPAVTK